ncbi:group 1 truncated hemoglobin [Sulfuritalea sp.]|uniref:group I truncated hemoglobin n=1 Tax=Sulfuritalea sp. TaxID=2480090 RepID=UPI00286E2360|nr:group 1 truncated hemoglobin [Sulfuritalea sp.]
MHLFAKKSVALLAGGLIAISLSAASFAAEKTLYDRLGGKAALQAVVGELWNNVAADARINGRFKHTKPEAFGGQLVEFLCQASGGPCRYQGKDMKSAHTGMKLTDAEFNALAEDTTKALNKFKVPAKEQSEVIGMLASLKGDVVGR